MVEVRAAIYKDGRKVNMLLCQLPSMRRGGRSLHLQLSHRCGLHELYPSGEIVQRLCGGPSSPAWECGSVAALRRTSRLKQIIFQCGSVAALSVTRSFSHRESTFAVVRPCRARRRPTGEPRRLVSCLLTCAGCGGWRTVSAVS